MRTSELRGVPFLFFVNKQDIENAITPRQLEEVFNTKQIQTTRPLHVQPLTAINGYESSPPSPFSPSLQKINDCEQGGDKRWGDVARGYVEEVCSQDGSRLVRLLRPSPLSSFALALSSVCEWSRATGHEWMAGVWMDGWMNEQLE